MLERMYTVDSFTSVSGVEILEYIRDNIDQLGWEVWDDYIDDGSYLVIKSTGSTHGDINRLPCYVQFLRYSTVYLKCYQWMYWDSEEHSGVNGIYYTDGDQYSYYLRKAGVYLTEDYENTIGLSGNSDILIFNNYDAYRGATDGVIHFRLDDLIWDGVGTVQNDAGAGTNVTVQLLSGQASTLAVGGSYAIITPIGQISYTSVTNLDLENDTAILGTVNYPITSGTVFGVMPYPWITIGNASHSTNYSPVGIPYVESNVYASDTYVGSIYNYFTFTCGVIGAMNEDVYNHGQVSLLPYLIYRSSHGLVGTCSYIKYFNYGSKGDIMGVNERDTGSVESSTTTSITASNKYWVEDVFIGMTLVITSGDYEESSRYITANTLDTITFDPELSPTISGGVTFSVCDAVYMRLVDGTTPYTHDYLGIKAV